MFRTNAYSTICKSDLHCLIMSALCTESDLIMKIVTEGISITESEDINFEVRLLINNLNCQLLQHTLEMLDYSYQLKDISKNVL